MLKLVLPCSVVNLGQCWQPWGIQQSEVYTTLRHKNLIFLVLSIPLCWVLYILLIWLPSKHKKVLIFLVPRFSHI